MFVVFTIGLVSDAIFHEEAPETAGYVIEAAEEGEGGGGLPVAKKKRRSRSVS